MGQIIGFGIRKARPAKLGWATQEIAEFYRVESALIQAGLSVQMERGVSDEGDPWLVFCHGESLEVIAHFARIDGEYIVDAPALPKPLRGHDLTQMVRRFVSDNPVSMPNLDAAQRGNVVFHPAMLLTIFVATMLILDMPAKGLASEMGGAEGEAAWADKAAHYPVAARDREAADHKHDQASSEKAMLIAAITLAAGMAEFGMQNGEDVLPKGFLEHGPNLPDGEGEGRQGSHSAQDDLIGLSKMDFDGIGPSDQQDGHDQGRAEAGAGGMTAVREAVPQHEPGQQAIDISLLKANPHPTGGEQSSGLIERAGVQHSHEAVAVQEEGGLAAESNSNGSGATGSGGQAITGAAASWLDKAAVASGWTFAVADQQKDEAQYVAAIVDQHLNVPPPADEAEQDAAVRLDVKDVADADASANAAIVKAIGAFWGSDDDILMLVRGGGSRVLFDQSDVADSEHAGRPLEMHSWAFDDGTTISILGNAAAVDHALVQMV
jgi:hypothetical protein